MVGDGICATAGAVCTVRAAVEEADAGPAVDEIVLGPGVHSLSSSLSVSNNDVTIRGAGAAATTINQTTSGERVLAILSGNVTRGGRGRTLGAGSFRVRVEATDTAGNRSVRVDGRFSIVG